MKLLAIDPADKCGWAMYNDGIITSGVWTLRPPKLKGYEGGGMRFARLMDNLNNLENVDRLAYEEVRRHIGTAAAHSYGGYKAKMMSWCEKQEPKVPYCVYSVSSIKKRATGNGRASKEDVKLAAEKKFNIVCASDDESDALWILVLMCEDMGIEI